MKSKLREKQLNCRKHFTDDGTDDGVCRFCGLDLLTNYGAGVIQEQDRIARAKESGVNCPICGKPGYVPPAKGRPKKTNDAAILAAKKRGRSLAQIADRYGITRGAVQAALKRAKK